MEGSRPRGFVAPGASYSGGCKVEDEENKRPRFQAFKNMQNLAVPQLTCTTVEAVMRMIISNQARTPYLPPQAPHIFEETSRKLQIIQAKHPYQVNSEETDPKCPHPSANREGKTT